MDVVLFVLVSLLVSGFVLAFYMDWLSLWVSKEEMREQIDRAKERMQELGKQKQPPPPDPGRFRSSGDAVADSRPNVRDNDPRLSEPEYEPVHGWTKRQLDDYLTRNPAYRPTYKAALQEHCYAVAPGVNGPSLDWFGPRSINHDKVASNTEPNGAK